MTNLAAVADAYDAWVKQRYAELDEMYYYYNGEVARRHGANSRQAKGFLALSTTVYGLYMASQMVGQGFVDVLRVGESLGDPSLGNIAQDGLRLVSLAAPAFKVLKLGSAIGVSGGNFVNSCGATATAFAARLSGTKIAMRLKDFQTVVKLPLSPKNPNFPGVTIAEMDQALGGIGAKTMKQPISSWQEVEALLDLDKGPVIFGVVPARGGIGHIMAAFRVLGETSIADQNGIIRGAVVRDGLINAGYKFVTAWVVEESALVHAVNLASGTAVAVNANGSWIDSPGAEDLNWLLETLLIPAWIIPGQVLWGLGDLVNEKLGRPPLRGNGGLSADATKVLRVTPNGAGKSCLMVQIGSGLSADAFLAAVAELESNGRVRVVRAPGAPLGIVSIVRLK